MNFTRSEFELFKMKYDMYYDYILSNTLSCKSSCVFTICNRQLTCSIHNTWKGIFIYLGDITLSSIYGMKPSYRIQCGTTSIYCVCENIVKKEPVITIVKEEPKTSFLHDTFNTFKKYVCTFHI